MKLDTLTLTTRDLPRARAFYTAKLGFRVVADADEQRPVAEIQSAMFEKHLKLVEEAGKKGVQALCLQEIFNGPYFCPSKDKRWYDAAEAVPGPTVEKLKPYAKKYGMAMVIPVYEREQAGVYYNSAAVLDHDGTYLGKYRKNHIPDCQPGF